MLTPMSDWVDKLYQDMIKRSWPDRKKLFTRDIIRTCVMRLRESEQIRKKADDHSRTRKRFTRPCPVDGEA